MAGPDGKPSASSAPTFSLIAAPMALVAALVLALGSDSSEGRRYTAYQDSIGIWTVCAGITGKDVIRGKRYTPEECAALETAYIQRMLAAMGQCVRGQFKFHEAKAWGHFAYNIGTSAFCRSTAARRLNAGERETACAEISRYVYAGGRDCRIRANNCAGIPKRRAWERATCEGRLQ